MDCIFCKIANGEISANKVYEDDGVLAFHDLEPQAPVHILIIPKAHIASAAEIGEAESALAGKLLAAAAKIAGEQGLTQGFRLVINCGESAGQSVQHLHVHLLGGRDFGWPPG